MNDVGHFFTQHPSANMVYHGGRVTDAIARHSAIMVYHSVQVRRAVGMSVVAAVFFLVPTRYSQTLSAQSAGATTSTVGANTNDGTNSGLGVQPSAAGRAVIDRVRALMEAGSTAQLHTLLDSMVNASASASLNASESKDGDLAEALYWRASTSERAADAERDWKRLVLDVPSSPRVPGALLKLGEMQMTSGRSEVARQYFTRVLRDYARTNERWWATLGVVRSYFDERDVARACTTLASIRIGDVPEGEQRLQARDLQLRCNNEQARLGVTAAVSPGTTSKNPTSSSAAAKTGVPSTGASTPVPKSAGAAGSAASATAANSKAQKPESVESSAKTDSAKNVTRTAARSGGKSDEKSEGKSDVKSGITEGAKSESPSSGIRYSVQVAAYDTRTQAETTVQKLAKRGFKARVDGTHKPFRVRVGAYTTRAEADAALARMKKAGQKGFVAEVMP